MDLSQAKEYKGARRSKRVWMRRDGLGGGVSSNPDEVLKRFIHVVFLYQVLAVLHNDNY